MTIQWTERAQDDLAAIYAFVESDSPHYATVLIRRLIHAVERLHDFPQSGRAVAEYNDLEVREVVLRPYRIVYRLVSTDVIHVVTVHHGARGSLSTA